MRAIVITEHGGPEVFVIRELPDPIPGDGDVLIRVKAFGLNHADTYMRSGVWSFGIPVLGIEAAGIVEADRSGRFAPGTAAVAIVGGMARTRNGSYAEKVSVPAGNVVAVKTRLSWAELAAIPEAYATAWIALHANLGLQVGETLLVRGATSTVGQAAVNIAVKGGATVIATTRTESRRQLLCEAGANDVLIDDGALAEQVRCANPGGVDAVLDLVGNSVLRDSLLSVRPKGRVVQVGFLGGLKAVADFNPLFDLPSGVQLSTFASAVALGDPYFPITDVPLQELIENAEHGAFNAKPARVFAFEEIAEAHRLMDAGEAGGKLVVSID